MSKKSKVESVVTSKRSFQPMEVVITVQINNQKDLNDLFEEWEEFSTQYSSVIYDVVKSLIESTKEIS